jgi:hypothetical protein
MVRFIKSPKLSVFVIAGETWRRPAALEEAGRFRLDDGNSNDRMLIDDKTIPNYVNYFHTHESTLIHGRVVSLCIPFPGNGL